MHIEFKGGMKTLQILAEEDLPMSFIGFSVKIGGRLESRPLRSRLLYRLGERERELKKNLRSSVP
jgi:hypothetical protein